jgi:acyl carrier protein
MSSASELVLELIKAEGAIEADETFGIHDDLFLAGLDSMGIMQLLLAIEERCGVVLEPADLTRANFASAASLAGLIVSRGGCVVAVDGTAG